MTEFDRFVLAALLLLLTPGPTNTLLAAGGATLGARRALPLVGAEVAGYAVAIVMLEIFVAPVAEAVGWVGLGLRIACGLYLAFVAWKLWGSASHAHERATTFGRVFLATLSNPKATVFVFVILPPRSIGLGPLLEPYGVVLLLLIALAGSAWVLLGALVHASSGGRGAALVPRTSSVVVALFSVIVVTGAAAPLPAEAGATAPHPALEREPPAVSRSQTPAPATSAP
jgi:threonine/homoserine/homoserine lactone efflux protein